MSKAALPIKKYPMDMTIYEHEELGKAADERRLSKKALIYEALKKAYGIDLEAANDVVENRS